MKKVPTTPTSENLEPQTPVTSHPRAVKDNSAIKEDKRKTVREEHTNHFTNRAGYPEKK